jgi:hypothetical protein
MAWKAVMVGAVLWIKIQIRIDLGQLDPDPAPAPGGTKRPTNIEKLISCFVVLDGCSL